MATRPTEGTGTRDTPPGGDVDPLNVDVGAGVAMVEGGVTPTAAIEYHSPHGDFL